MQILVGPCNILGHAARGRRGQGVKHSSGVSSWSRSGSCYARFRRYRMQHEGAHTKAGVWELWALGKRRDLSSLLQRRTIGLRQMIYGNYERRSGRARGKQRLHRRLMIPEICLTNRTVIVHNETCRVQMLLMKTLFSRLQCWRTVKTKRHVIKCICPHNKRESR